MRRSGDKFFETECYVVIQFEPSLSASGGEGAALYCDPTSWSRTRFTRTVALWGVGSCMMSAAFY